MHELTIHRKKSKFSFSHHLLTGLLLITMIYVSYFFIPLIVFKLYNDEGDTVENVDFEKRAVLANLIIPFHTSVGHTHNLTSLILTATHSGEKTIVQLL